MGGVADELWTAKRIATEFHFSSPAVARGWLARQGIKHKTSTGPRDERLYDPQEVLAARRRQVGDGP